MDLINLWYIIPSILLLLAMIFVIYAHVKVNSTFSKYSKVRASCNMTASEVARKILDANNVKVDIMQTEGDLTDNYNPQAQVIQLSTPVYNSSSVASIGVASHEVGHAIQDDRKYFPMRVRTMAIKVSNFASSLLLPFLGIGTMFWFVFAGTNIGLIFIVSTLIVFTLGFIVNLATLPVEINASRRALKSLDEMNILTAEEHSQVKKVLTAAALTYVASLAVSLIVLFRLLVILFAHRRD